MPPSRRQQTQSYDVKDLHQLRQVQLTRVSMTPIGEGIGSCDGIRDALVVAGLDGVAKKGDQTGELPGDIGGVIRVDFAEGEACPSRDLADSAGEQVQLVNGEAGDLADLVGNGEVGVMQHIDIYVDQDAVEYRGPREEPVEDCVQVCSDDGDGFVTNVELLNNAPLRLGEQIGGDKVHSLWWQKRGPGPRVGQAWFDAIDGEDVGQPHPVQDAIAGGGGVEVTVQVDVDQTY